MIITIYYSYAFPRKMTTPKKFNETSPNRYNLPGSSDKKSNRFNPHNRRIAIALCDCIVKCDKYSLSDAFRCSADDLRLAYLKISLSVRKFLPYMRKSKKVRQNPCKMSINRLLIHARRVILFLEIVLPGEIFSWSEIPKNCQTPPGSPHARLVLSARQNLFPLNLSQRLIWQNPSPRAARPVLDCCM